jgi:soluble lytic murein transglycosylase-like protein
VAKKYDIDANLIAIIITMESGGNPKAKSEAGAEGLMQLTPPTAKDISTKYLKEPVNKYDIYNPKTNIEFGAAYLAMLRDQYGTQQHAPDFTRTVELMAAAYNAGFGAANALEKGEGLRDTHPVIYSRDAFNMWRERVSKSSPTFDRWKERGGTDLLNAAAQEQK